MNYGFLDAGYLSLSPARWSAAAMHAALTNPLNPLSYTLPGRMLSAYAEVFDSVAERRGKPAWKIDAQFDVVDERPFCRLLRFSIERQHHVPRILLVAPLSGHYATLLRGTVEALLADHDVYVTDWIDAREVPLAAGDFDLESYITYLIAYMRMLGPDVNAVAVCQPAPLVLAAVALLAGSNDPAQPRTMTLMGGPIDTRFAPTAPTEIAAEHSLEWFERELTTTLPVYYRGAGRRVYPGVLQLSAFIAMNPQRHIDAHINMFNELVRGDGESAAARRRFYAEYLSVMDLPADYYLATIDQIFQRHTLPLGTMTWRGERVNPAAIRSTALLTVEGEFDDIAAPGQTYAAHEICASLGAAQRDHLLVPGVGHYGLFNGRRWRETTVSRITGFIRQHA